MLSIAVHPRSLKVEESGVDVSASTAERAAMAAALALAGRSARTHPNPRVGAMVLDAFGTEVGSGVHRGAGSPHAEIEALAQAGAAARGATVLVTLEPCNHTGRTRPCTEALIAAGVARVVFGQPDPNPVAAGGTASLTAAGVEVAGGVLADAARALNQVWSFAMEQQRPLVTWKVASTLDGRIAATDRSSRWISSTESRAEVHRIRATVDAVVVGTGTVLADDPQLTARDEQGALFERQPLRVVVGERSLPRSARVLNESGPVLHVKTRDVRTVIDQLFASDVHHVLLEGGPTLAAAFLIEGLVDRVLAYVGPTLLGSGPSLVGVLGIDTISDALHLTIDDVALVSGDIRWTARIHEGAPPVSPFEPGASPRQDSLRQDSLRQDSLRQDSLRQDSLRQDSLRQEES